MAKIMRRQSSERLIPLEKLGRTYNPPGGPYRPAREPEPEPKPEPEPELKPRRRRRKRKEPTDGDT